MSIEFDGRKEVGILPFDIAQMSSREALPLIENAARKIGLVYNEKDGFLTGLKDNLEGLAAWIKVSRAFLNKKAIVTITGTSLIAVLSACSPNVVGPLMPSTGGDWNLPVKPEIVPPLEATKTPLKVGIASPPATTTPEPTATLEIKQYPICSAENYMNCYIPPEDLLGENSNYFRWLQTLSKPFENPLDLKTLTCDRGNPIFCRIEGGSLKDPKVAPLRRGVTFGYTEAEVIVPSGKNRMERFLVLPAEFYNASDPDHSYWVVFIMPGAVNRSEKTTIEYLEWWSHNGALVVNRTDYYGASDPKIGVKNPIVSMSFQNVPAIALWVDSFMETGNPSLISGPGLLLETTVARD